MSGPIRRWAWAEIDLTAVARNVAALAELVAPATLYAVVKANGYGHGAVQIGTTALDAGAAGLAVALAEEGIELRRAGVEAPILVLSEQPPESAAGLVEHDLTPTVYTAAGAGALVEAGAEGLGVHVKVDTGMQRVGATPDEVGAVVRAVVDAAPALRLAGVFTHLAIADEPDDPFTADQIEWFDAVVDALALDDGVVVHAANSAGGIAHRAARKDLVRAGIAVYGISPGPELDAQCCGLLSTVMSLHARVAHVKRVAAGSRISYGLRHRFAADTNVATLPIGYADGVPRRLFETGGCVLVGGVRRPIVGVVTMDQLMVDCGDDEVAVGDEAVLIGRQGGEQILAEDWARALGTIGYEIVCGIGPRVPRVYHRRPE